MFYVLPITCTFRMKKPKDKVLGQDIPWTSGIETPGCPVMSCTGALCKAPFLCRVWQRMAGMYRDLGTWSWCARSGLWENFSLKSFRLIFLSLTILVYLFSKPLQDPPRPTESQTPPPRQQPRNSKNPKIFENPLEQTLFPEK